MKAHDPGVLHVLLTSQAISEQLGGNFDPEKFGECEYEGLGPTIVRLNERSLRVCHKHAKIISRMNTDDKASRPDVGKPRLSSG